MRQTDTNFSQMIEQARTDRPLHIIHVIETLGPGGAERLLYTNLKRLDPTRFRSAVVTVFSRGDHWAEPVGLLGAQVFSLNCSGYRDLARGATALQKWLRAERPDLLHTHLWAANVIGRMAGKLAGVPVISSIHDSDYEPETWSDGSDVSRWKLQMARAIDRLTARYGCERLIAVSEYVRHSAHNHLGFPLDRIVRLYNPVDVNELQSSHSKSRKELLEEIGLPADSVILLNVGRVTAQKGLLYAIRALPLVKQQHATAQLISVGGTDDKQWVERLRAEAESLGVAGQVHLLGARRDVPDFLRACDLFLFPSLHEGLGIALIEAMALGCACIAADAGPLPEVIHHGIDGYLVAPRDHAKLADAICALLQDSRQRAALGEAARQTALSRFQPQLAADELAALYESVANARARPEAMTRQANTAPARRQ